MRPLKPKNDNRRIAAGDSREAGAPAPADAPEEPAGATTAPTEGATADAGSPPETGSGEPSDTKSWTDELSALLDEAARLAIDHGAEVNPFMNAAHEAYLRANPELREQVERTTVLQQMEHWRSLGILAVA